MVNRQDMYSHVVVSRRHNLSLANCCQESPGRTVTREMRSVVPPNVRRHCVIVVSSLWSWDTNYEGLGAPMVVRHTRCDRLGSYRVETCYVQSTSQDTRGANE